MWGPGVNEPREREDRRGLSVGPRFGPSAGEGVRRGTGRLRGGIELGRVGVVCLSPFFLFSKAFSKWSFESK